MRRSLTDALQSGPTGLFIRLLASLTLVILAACGGSSTPPNVQAPSALVYATSLAIYTKDMPITANTPTNTGGPVASYSISPSLPAGLALNTTSGAITGIPTAVTAAATYTVTATNTGGNATATLSITVNDAPPMMLTYALNPAAYIKGMAIPVNSPSNTGGSVVSYAIDPVLPPGLSLNTHTGVIDGTPTAEAATGTYTVTATNSGGSTTAVVSITVHDAPPNTLIYSANPATYTLGQSMTPNLPSNLGGTATSYSIFPSLPAGLTLSTSTGVITGIPAELRTAATYTVTAANLGGSTTALLSISVIDVPPSTLSYPIGNLVFTKGLAITPSSPSSSGGAVVSYSVAPALPAGLNLDASTGVIAGVPTAAAASATYTVTATNSGGSTPTYLTITVKDLPPASLTYSANPATYTKGATITPNTPANTGGTVVSYSVSPSLPAGLVLNTSTGVIAGLPTALTASATYTVTATNTGGATTATLSIAVNDAAPTNLAYLTSPAVYTKGIAITANIPTTTGGPVISYAITPSLPPGLSFNTSTGIIAGTPTAVTPVATYTVTATNTGGSASTALLITVNDVPPNALVYAVNPAIYTRGTAIAPNAPISSGGGPAVTYSVSPNLPLGLALDTSTGVISGTPTVIASAANYTVTVANSGGFSTAILSVTVKDIQPSNLTYATNPVVYTMGLAITPNTPAQTGGPAVSFSITPALPAGLTLNSSTGVLTGTPTVLAVAATYIVTATNSGGTTTAPLVITINDVAPSISYGSSSFLFTTNIPITPLTPTNSGGPVVTWSINPPLPTGLSFSTTTGSISGTPTVITAHTSYTVTATNTGGSCLVTPFITVNPPAPTIGTQPSNQFVSITQSATFSVGASGSGVLGYQWLRNGTPISGVGATSSSYNTPAASLSDNGVLFSVVVSDGYGQSVTSAAANLTVVQGLHTPMSPLITPRNSHTATLLPNGKVLVTGGANGATVLASAELFDPATGIFTAIAGPMTTARMNHTATLLPNGKVLISGGSNGTTVLSSAELYDPAAGTFTSTASPMSTTREFHSATLLPNGKVLIAGGYYSTVFASAELYDPATGLFAATGSMGTARAYHTATLLPNGQVLVAGGSNLGSTFATSELYDPNTGLFTASGALGTGRYGHTAMLLPNGKVLVVGGKDSTNTNLASAELYDQAAGNFTTTGSMGAARFGHNMMVLPDGLVLVVGGKDASNSLFVSAELYDPSAGSFSLTGSLVTARTTFTTTMLPNGKVLIAGGANATNSLGNAEAYDPQDPAPGVFTATGPLATTRALASATLLPNGKILIAGGTGTSGTIFASAEIYDPASRSASNTGSMANGRFRHAATLLPNGKVLITGGSSGLVYPAAAELYDPALGTFATTSTLGGVRQAHTATLLPNGQVLIVGGWNGTAALNSAELYNASTGLFVATGSMGTARQLHTATLLPNGKVLIAGGDNGITKLSTAELYDPSTGAFTATGSMLTGRDNDTATLMPNGRVLVTGGWDGSVYTSAAEVYDPNLGTFAPTGSMGAVRSQHTATLLPSGKILIAGGSIGGAAFTTAELYDPATGVFTPSGSMISARAYFSTLLMPNGKVLTVGGLDGSNYLASAEQYQ